MKKYNWVVLAHGMAYYFKDKPKKVRGGYKGKNGKSFIGSNIILLTTYMYSQTFN